MQSLYASLPADVLDNHIWTHLSLPSLIANSFVCKRFHQLLANTISFGGPNSFENYRVAVYKELFARGEAQLIRWFQNYLKYPKPTSSTKWLPGAIEMAVLGISCGNTISFTKRGCRRTSGNFRDVIL